MPKAIVMEQGVTFMKISVVMIDGGFRENIYAAQSFCQQDFPRDQYEVLWVEFYSRPHAGLARLPAVKVHTLQQQGIYHSSYCFNAGIRAATGEVLVIPDADQYVAPDFLFRVWELHNRYDRLVAYGYRLDELERGVLQSHHLAELRRKCVLKNPTNYGGCLTVRKTWLELVNGYEQHPLFQTGNHANGLDMYTRFKNVGLAVQWEPALELYHPWHPATLESTREHKAQWKIIEWRRKTLQWQAFNGLDPGRNVKPPPEAEMILTEELRLLQAAPPDARSISSAGHSDSALGVDPALTAVNHLLAALGNTPLSAGAGSGPYPSVTGNSTSRR
ncbi:MAG: glycosyltransferase [Planctomycetota bacterium]